MPRINPETINQIDLERSSGLEKADLRGLEFIDEVLGKVNGKSFKEIILVLLKIYKDIDAQLIEINPLVLTGSNELVVCDAKIIIDDNKNKEPSE